MEVDNASESSSHPQDGQGNAAVKQEDHPTEIESLSGQSDADDTMVSSKSKDPSKPKRKKARRACAACQRAHLTCGMFYWVRHNPALRGLFFLIFLGDERPCQRCVKRNLAPQCHDGARKKAKYLRDTPNEILEVGHRRPHGQSKHSQSPDQKKETRLSSLLTSTM